MIDKYFLLYNIDIIYLIILHLNNFELRALLLSCKSIYKRSLSKNFWKELTFKVVPNYPISLRNVEEIRKCYFTANFGYKILKYINTKGRKYISMEELMGNKVNYCMELCQSLDFDIFLFGISKYQSILDIFKDNLDRRNIFGNFFKYLSPEYRNLILSRTDLKVILDIPQIDKISNINLLEIYFNGKHEFISNSKYSHLLIQTYQNNDEECFYYLYEKALKDKYFLRHFCLICIEKDEVELFEFGLEELYYQDGSILDLLELHGSIIPYNFWQIIIDDYYEDFYFYFEMILKNNSKLSEKIYNIISGLYGINEVRTLYLKYLLSLPLSKYRTQEDKIINIIHSIVNTIKDPYDLGDLLRL